MRFKLTLQASKINYFSIYVVSIILSIILSTLIFVDKSKQLFVLRHSINICRRVFPRVLLLKIFKLFNIMFLFYIS